MIFLWKKIEKTKKIRKKKMGKKLSQKRDDTAYELQLQM
jgi:hypothetical protein